MSQEEIQKRLKLMEENCLFCKIVKKEINAQVIFEDEICLAILDINPATKGHMLLMPKKHHMIFPTLPDDLIAHMSIISKYLTDLVCESLGANDVLVYSANGAAAGQQAHHYMMHLIPQYTEEEFKIDTNSEDIEESIMNEIKEKMISKINKLNEQIKN